MGLFGSRKSIMRIYMFDSEDLPVGKFMIRFKEAVTAGGLTMGDLTQKQHMNGTDARCNIIGGGYLEIHTEHAMPQPGMGTVRITVTAELSKDALKAIFSQAETQLKYDDNVNWYSSY